MKKLLYVLLLLSLTGCGATIYVPPVQSNIQNEKVYDVPYDKLWAASVKVFADRTWEIKTIEKVSGIIVGESMYDFGVLMDCGSYETTYPASEGGTVSKKEIVKGLSETLLKYNFYVKDISANQSSLKINLTGRGRQLVYIPPPMLFAPPTQNIKYYDCISNGILEKTIFGFVENNLSSK